MAKKPYPPPSRLTDYYSGAGRLAVAWSFFEAHLNLMIWEVANVQQQVGACITAQIIPIMPRFRALVALVELRGGTKEMTASLNKLGSEAEGLGRQRNRYIHDPAFTDDQGQVHRLEITADRKLAFELKPSALPEIQALESKIEDVTRRFFALKNQILAELPTFSRRQFEQSEGIRLFPPPDRRSES